MTQDADSSPPSKPARSQRDVREARRKDALKANMGRRKAQARARNEADGGQAKADKAEADQADGDNGAGGGISPGPEGE